MQLPENLQQNKQLLAAAFNFYKTWVLITRTIVYEDYFFAGAGLGFRFQDAGSRMYWCSYSDMLQYSCFACRKSHVATAS